MNSVTIDGLSSAIAKELSDWSTELSAALDEAAALTAKETAAELKRASPKKTGRYAKGWRVKKPRNGEYTVYNASSPSFTHLLEHGHAKRGGGRTSAQPHIAPAEQTAVEDFIRRAEKAVEDTR